MPHIPSRYKAYGLFRNAHINTVLSNQFRQKRYVSYSRERIETEDGDFYDVDWSKIGCRRMMVFIHGLAGSTAANYVQTSCLYYNQEGWDAAALNYRGHSGEANRLLGGAHSGWTADLEHFLNRVSPDYEDICIIGQSLGGSIILNYLVKRKEAIPHNLSSVSLICPALHHPSGIKKMQLWINKGYNIRFIKKLRTMMRSKKAQIIQAGLDYDKIMSVWDLEDFDNAFTAPVHGYKDAIDYYEKNTVLDRLSDIDIPLYMLCTLDDPFFDSKYYPIGYARRSKTLYIETPKHGGHCGMWGEDTDGRNYAERRCISFSENRAF